MPEFTIALAGNPNTGKTTIFNSLTGSHQHTGNWPGKTVEKKEGTWRRGNVQCHIIDLPGAYSLSAYSAEEAIARDFIVEAHPHGVVAVVDATNLERNLYLVVQILEMTPYVVVALNMMDAARAQGLSIDGAALEARLGVPVIPMTARTGEGMDQLIEAMIQTAQSWQEDTARDFTPPIHYSPPIEASIQRLEAHIRQETSLGQRFPPRWLALQLLENPDFCQENAFLQENAGAKLCDLARQEQARLQALLGRDVETLLAAERYTWIHDVVQTAVQGRSLGPTLSDRVDAVAMHPVSGLILFFALMWVVFKLSTDVAAPLVDWINLFVGDFLAHWVLNILAWVHWEHSWLASLLTDGILAGVGGVLVFVPVLMFLYMGMAILEDSGYMARAAFVMDRYMRLLGLQGKSFVPLILGFGCNVPAIYATRTLEKHSDRILTGMLVPFMSCSARLPVYVLIATIFFPRYRTLAVLSMYVLGILVALTVGLLLRRTLFQRTETSALLIEVPAYRLPTLKNVWTEMWLRTRAFIHGAATIIMMVSVIIWLFLAIPVKGGHFADTPVDDSAFAYLADGISPLFQPLGFGNWQNTSALMSGFIAKEVVVSTMAQVYHVPTESSVSQDTSFLTELRQVIQALYQALIDTLKAIPGIVGMHLGQSADGEEETPMALGVAIRQGFDATSHGRGSLAALAFMVFVLLYTPCMATLAAMRQELGGKWTVLSVGLQLSIAWLAAFLLFQGGSWLFP